MNTITRYERVASWNPNAQRNTHTQQWEFDHDPGLVEILAWVVVSAFFTATLLAFLVL